MNEFLSDYAFVPDLNINSGPVFRGKVNTKIIQTPKAYGLLSYASLTLGTASLTAERITRL